MRKFILFLLIAFVSSTGYALTTDSILITVTAVFNLSVNISSATHTFGSAVGIRTSMTICAGTIQNDGNISSKWQKQTGSLAGSAGTVWSLKTSGTPATDEFRLLAITTGVTTSPNWCPAGSSFFDSCINGAHDTIGVLSAAATDLTEGGASSPVHKTGETKKLWVSLMMPYDISSGDQQTMTLSIRAVAQ